MEKKIDERRTRDSSKRTSDIKANGKLETQHGKAKKHTTYEESAKRNNVIKFDCGSFTNLTYVSTCFRRVTMHPEVILHPVLCLPQSTDQGDGWECYNAIYSPLGTFSKFN